MSRKFLVHGSIAYDLLFHSDGSFTNAIDVKNIETLSVSYLAPRYEKHHGGTAANIAWNLRLLGQEVAMVGAIGFDGGNYATLLSERGIDLTHVNRIADELTATAVVASDAHEHQITFFHPGADAKGTLPDLNEEREDIAMAIIGPRNPMLMLKAAAQCKELKIPYIFDPGQLSHVFTKDEFRRAITGARCLVANAYEWALTQEKTGWDASEILKVCPLIVITLGEQGLTLHTADDTIVVHACKPDRVLNPTGAGDALRSGLLIGLANGWSLQDTGRLGAAMGSFVVEQVGTLIDHLDKEDVRARVLENYGEELPKF